MSRDAGPGRVRTAVGRAILAASLAAVPLSGISATVHAQAVEPVAAVAEHPADSAADPAVAVHDGVRALAVDVTAAVSGTDGATAEREVHDAAITVESVVDSAVLHTSPSSSDLADLEALAVLSDEESAELREGDADPDTRVVARGDAATPAPRWPGRQEPGQ